MKSDRDKRPDLGSFNYLPMETVKQLFWFFNRRDLSTLERVNSTFANLVKAEREERKEKYKDNIFYTVGSLISVTYSADCAAFYTHPTSGSVIKSITQDDIVLSFSEEKIKTVTLFKTEEDAIRFANFLAISARLPFVGQGEQQAAIFKVMYLGDQRIEDDNAIELMASDNITTFTGQGIKTERINVIPLEGTLSMKNRLITMTYDESKPEEPASSWCVLA